MVVVVVVDDVVVAVGALRRTPAAHRKADLWCLSWNTNIAMEHCRFVCLQYVLVVINFPLRLLLLLLLLLLSLMLLLLMSFRGHLLNIEEQASMVSNLDYDHCSTVYICCAYLL